MTPDEARRDALERFGSRARVREDVREANVLANVERLWQDLRYGLRIFARNPGLTTIAIVSIAFGTGANVAIYSVADALLLRPLPIARPSELLTVGTRSMFGTISHQTTMSYLDYQDVRDRVQSFDGLIAYDYELVGLATRVDAQPKVRLATFVSENFFRVLGVEPDRGRGFRPDESTLAAPAPVAVLSHVLWTSEFDSNPAVIGRRIRIGGSDFTIVGVAPERFTGLHEYIRETIFLPLTMLPRVADLARPDALNARDVRMLTVKGRLRSGTAMAQAQAELDSIGRDLEQAYP